MGKHLAVAHHMAVALVQLAAGRVADIGMSVAAAAVVGPPAVAARLVVVVVLAAVWQAAGALAGCS